MTLPTSGKDSEITDIKINMSEYVVYLTNLPYQPFIVIFIFLHRVSTATRSEMKKYPMLTPVMSGQTSDVVSKVFKSMSQKKVLVPSSQFSSYVSFCVGFCLFGG